MAADTLDPVGVVAVVIGVAALVLALVTDHRVRKAVDDLKEVRHGLLTRWVGEFPIFVREVNEVLESAQSQITIFCDLPAYAAFSAPAGYATYRRILVDRQARWGSEKVRLLCLKEAQRGQLHEVQFPELNWHSDDPRLATFYMGHKELGDPPSKETQKDAVASRNHFLECLAEVQRKAAKDLDASMTDVIMPLYFWVADDREAVFAPTAFKASDREVAFRTKDVRLIRSLLAIFDEYADAEA